MTGVVLLIAAVVAALAFGGYRALTDGRFRGTRAIATSEAESSTQEAAPAETPGSLLIAAVPETHLGERATLLQFSSAFCSPCRAARRTLGEVADLISGVVHVEVDAESHLELVRSLGVLRTPTTLVLDGAGREVTRAAGAPRKAQVLSALGNMAD